MERGRYIGQGRRPAHAPPLPDLFALRQDHPELRQGGGRGCYHRPQQGRHPAVPAFRPSGAGGERPVLPDPVRSPRGRVHSHGRIGRSGGLVRRPVLCGLLRYLRPESCLAPGGPAAGPGGGAVPPGGRHPGLGGRPPAVRCFRAFQLHEPHGQALLPPGGLVGDSAQAHHAGLRAGPLPALQTLRLQWLNALHRHPGGGHGDRQAPPGHCGGQPRPAAQRQGHHRGGCGRHGQRAPLPAGGAGGGLFRHRV